MRISDISIRHPVFAWMLMGGLIFFGILAFKKMGVSQNPDVDFPIINVRVVYEGAAPEVIEKDIVDPIEGALASISGIKQLSATAEMSRANITVEFELDKNIDVAAQEVQTALSRIQRELPSEIDPPTVQKSNPEDRPIMWLSIRSRELSVYELMKLVKYQVRDQFTTVSGVSEVILGGYVEPALRVNLKSEKMREYQLTVEDVISSIQRDHQESPAGYLESHDRYEGIRVKGEATSIGEFKQISIKRRGGSPNYTPIALSQVADIREDLMEVRRISRVHGDSSVGIGIKKQRGTNAVQVGRAVKEKVERIQSQLPKGVQLDVNYDTTPFIQESIRELNFTLILSAVLTALVCWLFLGSFAVTLNVILAIPTSIFGAFIFIEMFGFTLNFFSLLALVLAIGIVVDDAIIVLENIVRHRSMGKSRILAASQGAQQITLAVLATTIAVIAVFAPVANMEGILGKFLLQFSVTLCVAVALSAVEALTLTPMRCSQFLPEAHSSPMDHLLEKLKGLYARALNQALKYRVLSILISLVFFGSTLYLFQVIKKEFVPDQDESRLFLRLQTEAGSSLQFTDEKMKQIEERVSEDPNVERYFSVIGGFAGTEPNSAMMFVTLKNLDERSFDDHLGRRPDQQEVAEDLRGKLKSITGIHAFIQSSTGSLFGGRGGFPIEFSLQGPDWGKLLELTAQMKLAMEESNFFSDIQTEELKGNPQIDVVPKRSRAQELGVDIAEISKSIQVLFGGSRSGLYTQGGQRLDVYVQYSPEDRSSLESLKEIKVRNNRGELISLNEVVEVQRGLAPSSIKRENRIRASAMSANLAKGISQKEGMDKVEEIAVRILPRDYYLGGSGSGALFKESFASLGAVLLLGLVVAYMVLASQFNSFLDPCLILMALPFAISGALISLWMAGHTINAFSVIGIVLLMGLAKKNSILLVEFSNQLVQEGKTVREALLEACPLRLRPILMTTVATLAAALPASLNLGPGSESRIPMALVVIGGMVFSTLFTLFIVPALYDLCAPFKSPPEVRRYSPFRKFCDTDCEGVFDQIEQRSTKD